MIQYQMNKNILLLCSDNSSLSILAQAVLNHYLPNIEAQSAGYKKNKPLNPSVKKALIKDGSWNDEYNSKKLEAVISTQFDLVFILSPFASKAAKEFAEGTIVIEIEYEDPDYTNSTNLERFIKTLKMELIPITRDVLEL